MNSIDEVARKRFESDWLSGRSLAIKEYLPHDSRAETYLGTLEELVCIDLEFRWRQSKGSKGGEGETVSMYETFVPTRVEDYLREFPELQNDDIVSRLVEQEILVRVNAGYIVEPSEYRSRFPSLEIDDSLFSAVDGEATNVEPVQSGSHIRRFPHQFGAYLLTAQVGRGGMGAVYRATQTAAKRDVAIKIADVASLNESMRQVVCQRFEQETKAAASLSHDHVVPIYDVGMVDDQPYYAMPLIMGGDLGSMSKEEPLSSQQAAGYMVGVTRGVAEAHSHGMLHRDIKPQNILVDRESDRAMITDFGLARFTEEDSGMTHTGQVLGTPSFMAPEQIKDSRSIDHRADVYSLGGTLYHLLIGRPPFKAADMHETLRQVLNEEPVSPKQLNAAVDLDLDTICLKCLEKDPSERYQTAGEVADELQRYLDGKPILARPAGPMRKLVKWCRRNRGLAAALSVAAMLALVAFGALIVINIQNTIMLRNAEVTTKIANVSSDTIEDVYGEVNDEPLLAMPGVEPVRRRLLLQLLGNYEQLVELSQNSPAMRSDRAFALAAIGNMSLELNLDADEAQTHLLSALALTDELSQEQTSDDQRLDVKVKLAAGNAHVGLGIVKRRQGELEAALEHFQQAIKIRSEWVEAYPDDVEGGRKLANAEMNSGILMKLLGKREDAERLMLAAQDRRKGLLAGDPKNTRLRRDMAKGNFNFAFLELEYGDVSEAIRRIGESSQQFSSLAEEVRVDTGLWRDKIKSQIYEADLVKGIGTDEAAVEAAAILQEAVEDLRNLLNMTSEQTEYGLSLVELYVQAIETLLTLESSQVANLAAAEDAHQHLARVLTVIQEDAAADSDMQMKVENAPLDEAFLIAKLQHERQGALLSLGLDELPVALQTLKSASRSFDKHLGVVQNEPALSSGYQQMMAIIEAIERDMASN